MNSVVLDELIRAHVDEAQGFFKELFHGWETVDLIDEEPARSLVNLFYLNIGLKQPLIFFVDSPWTVCSLMMGLSDLSYGDRRIKEFAQSEYVELLHRKWWQNTNSFCLQNDIVHTFNGLRMTRSDFRSDFVSPLSVSKNIGVKVKTEFDQIVADVFNELYIEPRDLAKLLHGTELSEVGYGNNIRNIIDFAFADTILSILNHVYAFALKSKDDLMLCVESRFEKERDLREKYLRSYLQKNIYNSIVSNVLDIVMRDEKPDFNSIAGRIVNSQGVLPVFSGFELIQPLAAHAYIAHFAPGKVFGKKSEEKLKLWIDLGQSAYAYAFFVGVCFVIRRPIRMDLIGMEFHNEEMPALEFLDGYGQFYINGRKVPRIVVEEPENISIKLIYNEPNAEVRRIMIERFGLARFIEESGAEAIHEDDTGVLYCKHMQGELEPLVAVMVKNATPEPDGSFKNYMLRVPPETRTAREAVAWTFYMEEHEYQPEIES